MLSISSSIQSSHSTRPYRAGAADRWHLDVRRVQRVVDPFSQKGGCSEQQTPGSTAYPRVKVQRDRSMPSKRSELEGAEGRLCETRAIRRRLDLLEAQFPAAIGTPLDYSACKRGHRDTPEGNRSAERSDRWASKNDFDEGNE